MINDTLYSLSSHSIGGAAAVHSSENSCVLYEICVALINCSTRLLEAASVIMALVRPEGPAVLRPGRKAGKRMENVE
jgi:hypothetical protein